MIQTQGKLAKYTKIHSIGSPEIEELLKVSDIATVQAKLDGANARTIYDIENDKLVFGSRAKELPKDTNPNTWWFIRAMNKAFAEYKDEFVPNIQYTSESMQPHTITYDNIPDTVGYDCIDLITGEYLDWKESKKLFEAIGIPFIHIYVEKSANEITIEELEKYIKTPIYHKQQEEGVVVKVYSRKNKYGSPLFGKLVTDDFKEKNKAVFGENGQPKKQQPENEVKIADTYLTPARFIKALQHFEDDGDKIDMSLMPKLYRYVIKDVLSEHIIEISDDYNSINFPMLSKIIAGRCAQMLKSYLLTKAK